MLAENSYQNELEFVNGSLLTQSSRKDKVGLPSTQRTVKEDLIYELKDVNILYFLKFCPVR